MPESSASRLATAGLYGGFLITGMVAVLLGALIPELEMRWGVEHSQVASLFLAQFVASAFGAVASSFRQERSLIVGYGLMAAGLTGLASLDWPIVHLGVASVGLGLGLVIPATNLLVAHRNPLRRGAALATVNTVWGFGAVSCPLIFAALLDRVPAVAGVWLLAVLTGLTSLVLALAETSRERSTPSTDGRGSVVESPEEPSPGQTPVDPGTSAAPESGYPSPFLLILAAMLFLYVGAENAVGGWLVALSDQLRGERAAGSLLIGSGFWGAILAGRVAAPVLLRRLTEPTLYAISVTLAVAGILTILLADSRWALTGGALVTGVGMAPLFPLTVSILAAQTASTRSRKTGWVFAFNGLGGAVLPWLTGRLAGSSGALRFGFLVPLTGMVLLGILFAWHRHLSLRG